MFKGYLCFFISIAVIGLVTAVIGDVAGILFKQTRSRLGDPSNKGLRDFCLETWGFPVEMLGSTRLPIMVYKRCVN